MNTTLRVALATVVPVAMAAGTLTTCSENPSPAPPEPTRDQAFDNEPGPVGPGTIDYGNLERDTRSLLRRALAEVEHRVRRDAIRVLARANDRESLARLKELAEGDLDPMVTVMVTVRSWYGIRCA